MPLEWVVSIFKWLPSKLWDVWSSWRANRSRLHFYDPAVTYCYSFYDENENHVRSGGTKMIYEIYSRLTIRNDGRTEKILRNVRVVAIVGDKRFPMEVFDMSAGEWKSMYMVPGGTSYSVKWKSFPKAFGKAPGHTGLIPVNPPSLGIIFEVNYMSENGGVGRILVEVPEARMFDPRHIVE